MAERLVTTILLIDPCSESTAPGTDDPGPVIRRFGGRAMATDTGGLAAAWGPSAKPDEDAERAVRCGLELVGDGLAARVGVAIGDLDRAVAVLRPTPPGQVWVDDATRSRTVGAITYTDVGRHEVLGEPEPPRLFRAGAVVALVGGEGRATQLRVPLVGYAAELATIKRSLHDSIESRQGRLLLVGGAAGSGTSRLGRELEHYIDGLAGRVWWLWGRCSQGPTSAFSPLLAVLRGRIAANDQDDRDALRRKLDRALERLAVSEDERTFLSERLFVLLVGDLAAYPREELYAAWQSWLEHVGDSEPVAWIIDDAHRADDGLMEFVDRVVRTATSPVFVLVLGDSDLTALWGAVGSPERTGSIQLTGLPRDQMVTLVDTLVADLPAKARDDLVAAAGAIPLHAIELVRYLTDRGLVEDTGTTRRLGPGAPTALRPFTKGPAGLTAIVTARLDLLAADDRRLLDAAAVLGQSFALEALAAVAGRDEEVTGAGLARLADHDLVVRVGDALLPDFGQFTFVEPSVREIAYVQVARPERARLHRRAAEHLATLKGALADLRAEAEQHRLAAG